MLAALGLELCGTYRREVEVGSPTPGEIGHETIYHQLPLSTPKRIRGFLDSLPHAPGCGRARQALQYVLPYSASPMESVLLLLLCLPRRLGGYALPLPTLNPSIVFTRAGKRYTLRNAAKPDLFWQSKRLDLEYNSDEFHDGNQHSADSMRRKALEAMHVEVIELTHDELASTSLFHATALRVARRLGKRPRPEYEGGFIAARAELREHLLSDDTEMAPHSIGPGTPASLSAQAESHVPSYGTGEWLVDAEEWEGSQADFGEDWHIDVKDVDWEGIRVIGGRSAEQNPG